jgi:transposase
LSGHSNIGAPRPKRTRFIDDCGFRSTTTPSNAGSGGSVVGWKNHYGSKSLRDTQVAALFYTLCETENW